MGTNGDILLLIYGAIPPPRYRGKSAPSDTGHRPVSEERKKERKKSL
jgi:hypothetical protein